MSKKGTGAKPKDWVDWRDLRDGPWPSVYVNGDLENAEAEWLAANNLGAYSMSTVALMHTRRQHGLLVSHLAEDFRRHVVLSHLETTLRQGGRTYSLSTHQFPNMAPTLGYQSLESFSQDPLPRWVYRFPTGTIERTISLVHDRQAVVIALTWSGKEDACLTIRPLMPMRPSEELCHEHGGMLQKVTLRTGEVEVQPLAHLPAVLFRHEGVFMGFPDWWRKFEYLDDRGRYERFQEDMWSPGLFEFKLSPRQTCYLVVSVGRPPEEPPEELVMDAAQRRLRSDPRYREDGPVDEEATGMLPEIRALSVAAESFVFGEGAAIVAGYPWLDVWSRDTLLALPGIFLARGQEDRARASIRHLLRNMNDGLLVARTTCPEAERRPCVDASLWLFVIGHQVMARSREDKTFCDELYQAFAQVFQRITRSKQKYVWLAVDGLLASNADFALTWMEASFDGKYYTPRKGLVIEFQALWVRACEILCEEAESRGEEKLAQSAFQHAEAARKTFGDVFWCRETNYPLDCLSENRESAETWADSSLRPNALIALAVAPHLFEAWQVSEILSQVEEKLLTRKGLRTLEPSNPAYIGHAGPTIEERAMASHQGGVWPHLLLFYVRAKLKQSPADVSRLRSCVLDALKGGGALGHVGQSVDGDEPHRSWGIPASAMSTGMLLEVLTYELGADLD